MKSIQYTIRSIPPQLDKVLRERARKSGMSLNELTLKTLKKGAGLSEGQTHTDLDWFIGSKDPSDNELEENLKWLNSLPSEIDVNL